MYNINYVENLVNKEKYNYLILKLLKILNIVVHFAILALFVLSFFSYDNLTSITSEITDVKNSILQKRGKYKINQMEKEWDYYYYRLKAIKELNAKSTKFSYMLKELGQYLPEGDFVVSVTNIDKNTNIELVPEDDRLKSLSSFYDYAEVLNNSFADSTYMKKE
ncbi:MAG: hypothetical protein II816_04720, partial [Elusimicrobia bacterium]|nr:hypothetical protein [Elusimicrobiota bacterium]